MCLGNQARSNLRKHAMPWAIMLFLGSCLTLISSGFCQAPPPAPRDAQAVSTLQAAVNALGGQLAIHSIQDVTAQGSCSYKGNSSPVIWQRKGAEKRFQSGTGTGAAVFVTGHGNPLHGMNGTSQAWSSQGSAAAEMFYAPGFLLVLILNDTGLGLENLGQTEGSGTPAIGVRVTRYIGQSKFVQSEEWWFDPISGFPLAIKHFVPGESSSLTGLEQVVVLGTFQTYGGVQFPSAIASALGDKPTQQCSVASVLINSGLADSLFDSVVPE